jgi:fumarate reductase flavoprotein subunit
MSRTSGQGRSANLVIIGAGGAGLTAAVAALEYGMTEIVVLEKASSSGGNTAQSAGMFAIGSPAQKRKGIEVSIRDTFREKMEYANWRVDPWLVRTCIDRSGEIVAWLEDKGMYFDNVIEFLREGEAPKVFHSFSPGPAGFIGKKVADTLTEECVRGGVRILHDTSATEIVRSDQGQGRVSGVTARSGNEEFRIETNGVILATGGFGANKELLKRFFPGHADVFTKNYPEMTGDGLTMAEGVGASIDDNTVLLLTGPHHYPWSHALSLLVRRPDIVLVNKEGKRYCDETIFLDFHTEAGNALSRQPGMICYGLLDSSVKDRMITSGEMVSGMEREAGGSGAWLQELDAELEAGVSRSTVAKADSWEGIASRIGMELKVLSSTVSTYNDYCDRAFDDEFFKEAAFLRPLRSPPYYAVLGRQGFDTTLGGITVDRRTRVLDRRALPIPGLYAAGDCASGWEHENYNLRHPGSAMTFALCSGFIAGREAADYVGQNTR